MKKRIVICCDGTWQRLDSKCPTNAVLLAKAVVPVDPRDGIVQITFHLDGVGTGRGTGRIAKETDRILGGLLGSGLTEAVAEAYRLLVFNYRSGDEIFVLGFSRGAYTARSLVGMIRNCGILSRAHAERLPKALGLYRSTYKSDHPNGERSLAFRADFSSDVLTGDGEREWRERERPDRDWSTAAPLKVCYVGVWDTVGSLGVPATWSLGGLLNQRYRFHDTQLSSLVRAARHAVAIDERRRNFLPALWKNVDELNEARMSTPDAPYQQRWFPGVHSAVGGGGQDRRLASGTLLWILEGAERQGLAVDPEARAEIQAAADPLGPLSATLSRRRSLRDLLQVMPVDRSGPTQAHELSREAHIRWSRDEDYRPLPLRALYAVKDRKPDDLEANQAPPGESSKAKKQLSRVPSSAFSDESA